MKVKIKVSYKYINLDCDENIYEFPSLKSAMKTIKSLYDNPSGSNYKVEIYISAGEDTLKLDVDWNSNWRQVKSSLEFLVRIEDKLVA